MNNYIRVTVDGNQRGLKFTQNAYAIFYKEFDNTSPEGTFIHAALWAGLKGNAFAKREEFTEDWETVGDWADMLSKEDKDAIVKVFTDNQVFEQINGKEAEVEDKTPEEKKRKLTSTMKTA